MTLALPENLKLRFPGKSVFPSVQVDYLISSSPTSNASSPILGKLVIFFYLPENEKHSFSVALPLIIFISISADSDYPCAGWTVNPSPMTLSSSKTLPLQLSLFWPASILPSLWIIPIRLVVKILPATAGDERHVGLIPGSGRSPGGGNGNPLQHSCLENSTDRGAWWATTHGITESQTQLQGLGTPTFPELSRRCKKPPRHQMEDGNCLTPEPKASGLLEPKG